MKDWVLYVEDGKTKAMDATGMMEELRELCAEAGVQVLGWVAFNHERDAVTYGEVYLRQC